MLQSLFTFTGSIPWWIRVGTLLSGIVIPLLGTFLVLLDGIFHATITPAQLPILSPDWIIARNLFGGKGLSHNTHRVMGILLIAVSAYVLLTGNKTQISKLFVKFIMPVTLSIIALAVALKAFYGK